MKDYRQENQQRDESGSQLFVTFFYHENTPPPVSVEEGSLRILVPGNRPLTENNPDRWVYTGDLSEPNGANTIAHLKILHGNGDTLYKSSQADGSWIRLELQKDNGQPAGDIKIHGGTVLTVNSDARLTRLGGGNQKHSYHHQGGGAARFRVRSIKVTIGDPDLAQSPVRFHIDLGPVIQPFQSQEYRVLIWLH